MVAAAPAGLEAIEVTGTVLQSTSDSCKNSFQEIVMAAASLAYGKDANSAPSSEQNLSFVRRLCLRVPLYIHV